MLTIKCASVSKERCQDHVETDFCALHFVRSATSMQFSVVTQSLFGTWRGSYCRLAVIGLSYWEQGCGRSDSISLRVYCDCWLIERPRSVL